MAEAGRHFDIAVIGAGINGAGIARDAALRGLSVIVLEQSDLCSGTSWASSRLIHGGLRYLEYGEIGLVYESLHERRNLRRVAAHLIKPIRICIPIYESAKRGPLLIRLGMIAYDLLSYGKALPGHEMLSRDRLLAEESGLGPDKLRAAARYYDSQVTFAERLVLENLLAARSAGAEIHTYSKVDKITVADAAAHTIVYTDQESVVAEDVTASVIVNAAGPWVDSVLGVVTEGAPRLIGGTKGSHIIVGSFDGAPRDAIYVEAAADGRPIFIIPWNGQYLIGTTDIRYDGDPGKLRASRQEIDYLLSETNRVFPRAGLGVDDIHFTYAGVRPLPYRAKGPESAISRRHIIKQHRDIGSGLFSIIGGKLTTYRSLAEQVVDRVGKVLRRELPECRTHDTPLPGGWGLDESREALTALDILSESGVKRLISIYGGRAIGVVELGQRHKDLAHCIDADRRILAAEVVFAIREEMARTLVDIVYRRMMVGLDADQGRALYDAIATLAAAEFKWDPGQLASRLAELRTFSDSLRVPRQ
jgi:glycerol-3-phosphate dehydrogenase